MVNICSVRYLHYKHFLHFLFNAPRCRGFNAGFTHLQLSHRTSFSLLTILFFHTQFHISIPFILLALVKNTRTEETSNNCPPGWPRLFNSIAALWSPVSYGTAWSRAMIGNHSDLVNGRHDFDCSHSLRGTRHLRFNMSYNINLMNWRFDLLHGHFSNTFTVAPQLIQLFSRTSCGNCSELGVEISILKKCSGSKIILY